MKKTLHILSFLAISFTQAQIVNIPDANFKNALLSASPGNYLALDANNNLISIDTNNDGEIQVSEAELVWGLDISNKNISSIQGIEAFSNLTFLKFNFNQVTNFDVSQNTNLTILYFGSNQVTNFDVSQNIALTKLYCFDNQITNLDVSLNTNLTHLHCQENLLSNVDISQNTSLVSLDCSSNPLINLDITLNTSLIKLKCNSNQLTNLDVSQNTNLTILYCDDNQISSLDISQNNNLTNLVCKNNSNLSYINLKNGNNTNIEIIGTWPSNFENLPNLQTVCVDDINTNLTAFINTQVGHPITFNIDCSIISTAGNTINGTTRIDLDVNGCDANDISLANMLIIADNGTDSFGTFTQSDGSYNVYTNEGNFNTSLAISLPSYFTANPSNVNNTFVDFDNTFTADFCIAPNQTINDVNISLIPISQARPGFNTTYQIVYKNVGTTVLNGDVILNFEDSKLNFLNADETISTQTSNSLIFNYANLNPFETRTIYLEFNILSVNLGSVLSFTASINPIAGDYTTDDNTFMLNQTVIGSYDPNDIKCLEGNEVSIVEADKYLHYIIRFQNKGTADAINVVVKNILDDSLDWSTLQLETTSHQNRVAIKNGNQVEFIFEDIHLPDETTDEAGSHGYIAYKIKPKNTVVLNDIIHNQANIFFDYNEAVPTNTASTQFVNVLAVKVTNVLTFTVYPIPTQNVLNIKSKTEITKIEIYSKLGQKLKETTQNQIDISNLTQGLYFVKVEDVNGNFGVKKIIKK